MRPFQFSSTFNLNNSLDESLHTVKKDTVHLLVASKKTVLAANALSVIYV
jgi:hypothetical protein